MTRKFTIFALAVILPMSFAFGLAAMDHNGGHDTDNQCPFIMIASESCASMLAGLNSASVHINSFLKLFSAGPSSSMMILILILLFASSIAVFGNGRALTMLILGLIRNRPNVSFIPKHSIHLRYWFSLHENSPSLN